MARSHFEQLNLLIEKLKIEAERTGNIETNRFFGGAAFYSRGTIISSLSPMGLAFILPEMQVEKLIESGKATYRKNF